MKKPRQKKRKNARAAKQQSETRALKGVSTRDAFGWQVFRSVYAGLGIVAAAITLLDGFETVLSLADWCRYLVHHWQRLTELFWGALFRAIGIPYPREIAAPMTFFMLLMAIAVGALISHSRVADAKRNEAQSWLDLFFEYGVALGVAILGTAIFLELTDRFFIAPANVEIDHMTARRAIAAGLTVGLLMPAWLRGYRELLHNVLLAVFVGCFYFVVFLPTANSAVAAGHEAAARYWTVVTNLGLGVFPFQMMSLLRIAPAPFLNLRFLWVWTVLASLLGLNWLSTLQLSSSAPAL